MQKTNKRGRPTSCKFCHYRFTHLSNENREYWINNKYQCPSCKVTYCNKPKTEKILFDLQDKYLKKRESYYMDCMIKIIINYTQSIVKKNYSNKLSSYRNLDYYTNNAVSYFIEEYFKNENYKVWGSFAGALIHKVKQAIFGKQEWTNNYSLDYELEDGHMLDRKIEEDEGIKSINVCIDDNLLKEKFLIDLQKSEKRYGLKDLYFASIAFSLSSNITKESIIDQFFNYWDRNGKGLYIDLKNTYQKNLSLC